MDENQNNDINNDVNSVQGGGVVFEENGGNTVLEESSQPEGDLENVLDSMPGVSVRNIMVQDSVSQQDEPSVESVVDTSTEVVDSMEEDTESYMEDVAV